MAEGSLGIKPLSSKVTTREHSLKSFVIEEETLEPIKLTRNYFFQNQLTHNVFGRKDKWPTNGVVTPVTVKTAADCSFVEPAEAGEERAGRTSLA